MDVLCFNTEGWGFNFGWKDMLDMPLNLFEFYIMKYRAHEQVVKDSGKTP
jgi:hypothetical protein